MKILTMVLAGGNGTRLHPLTAEHAKPALPFAAGYRIIDFVLGNLVNSGIASIHVLMQYKPRSLIEHIRSAWSPPPGQDGPEIAALLPESSEPSAAFRGTADAVYRNLRLIDRHKPDLVAVFAADHVYRMEVRQMARFHQERRAAVSIAAVRVPIARASGLGIMTVGPAGELQAFQEKPESPRSIPGDPGHAYASMGNYLFDPCVLAQLLDEAHQRGDADFGRDIMPRLPSRCRACAYDFATNTVPGVQPYEEPGYWRDVGTVESYRAAQRDVAGPFPRFRLANPEWPIRGEACRMRRRTALPGAMDPAAAT